MSTTQPNEREEESAPPQAQRPTESNIQNELPIFQEHGLQAEEPKTFVTLPEHIHNKIISNLSKIDRVCLSLVNKYMYSLDPPFSCPLSTGSPFSWQPTPIPLTRGCRHCCPVLFYPAHCELHFHLRPWMPKELTMCHARCARFTRAEPRDKGYCGTCHVSYMRRFERGRRHLDIWRPGEKQEKLREWYNDKNYSGTLS